MTWLLVADADMTSSKGSVQSTQGLVCVSESACFGDWRGGYAERGTADTAGVVDGQVDGG